MGTRHMRVLALGAAAHEQRGGDDENNRPHAEVYDPVPERFGHIPFGAAAANNGEPFAEGVAGDFGGTVQRGEPCVGHEVFGEWCEERAEEREHHQNAVGDSHCAFAGYQKPNGQPEEPEDHSA